MKRQIAAALCAAMLLTGCGGGNAQTAETTAAGASSG